LAALTESCPHDPPPDLELFRRDTPRYAHLADAVVVQSCLSATPLGAVSGDRPKSKIICIAIPLYNHAALWCPCANSELDSKSIACIVGILDWSSASPRSSFTRRRKRRPAVDWSRGSSKTSGRSENLATEKKMALSSSLEKYGPPHAISRVNTAVSQGCCERDA